MRSQPIPGQVIAAREVVAGDRVILPVLGARVVLIAEPSTFGMDETPCIRIVYALGMSQAFENRASAAKGMTSSAQPEAGLRPYLPDEPIAIERRAA